MFNAANGRRAFAFRSSEPPRVDVVRLRDSIENIADEAATILRHYEGLPGVFARSAGPGLPRPAEPLPARRPAREAIDFRNSCAASNGPPRATNTARFPRDVAGS